MAPTKFGKDSKTKIANKFTNFLGRPALLPSLLPASRAARIVDRQLRRGQRARGDGAAAVPGAHDGVRDDAIDGVVAACRTLPGPLRAPVGMPVSLPRPAPRSPSFPSLSPAPVRGPDVLEPMPPAASVAFACSVACFMAC